MNIFEKTNNRLTTSTLLKNFYNFTFQTKFDSINNFYLGKQLKRSLKEKAIILFSFGKDSLLTYSLLNELGIKTTLIFIREPQSIFENAHKKSQLKAFIINLVRK